MATFQATIAGFVGQTETDIVDAVGKIVFDLYGGVLRNTRVDKGRLRASWRLGIGSADTSNEPLGSEFPGVGAGSAPSGREVGRALDVISSIQLGDVIVISNSLPYAKVWNDEDRIVADTIDEVLGRLDDLLAEVSPA